MAPISSFIAADGVMGRQKLSIDACLAQQTLGVEAQALEAFALEPATSLESGFRTETLASQQRAGVERYVRA